MTAGRRALRPVDWATVGRGLDAARLHRWLAAALAGIAVGFLAHTARVDTAQTAARLESLHREMSRTYEALVAAERASTAVPARTAMAAPATVARPPSRAGATRVGETSRRPPAGAVERRPTRRRASAAARKRGSDSSATARAAPARPASPPAAQTAPPVAPAVPADEAREPTTQEILDEAARQGEAVASGLTEGDVLAFLQQFRRTFERMNADEIARLFDESGVDNGRVGRAAITRHYAERFDALEATRFVVSRPEILVEGDRAEIAAPYSATFVDVAGRSWAVDGIARWSILRTDEGMKIVRFERRESPAD